MSVLKGKKSLILILTVLCLIWLSGCEWSTFLELTPTPTNAPTGTPTPTPTNTPTPPPGFQSITTDCTSVTVTWEGSKKNYRINYTEQGKNKTLTQETTTNSACASGLEPNTTYEFYIEVQGEDGKYVPYLQSFVATTQWRGPGDPFKNAYTLVTVNAESKSVPYTSPDGCLGAKVWAHHDCYVYSGPELNGLKTAVEGGTKLNVSMADGSYCYRRQNGRWSLHVRAISSTGGETVGWIDADLVFIDLHDIFLPENKNYAMKFNRTNAYKSIFTIGGSSTAVDNTSAQNTRFKVLDSKDNRLIEKGYNVIPGITGEILPNYGEMNQMPVVWNMAEELLICQRNAFANGTTLIIYEGYRPNSTSHAVSDAVSKSGLLTRVYNSMTLANGYLSSNYTYANFIAYNSNHNKGIAVDLSLVEFTSVDKLGSELKMQTKMHTLDFRGSMSFNNANSNLLYQIMTTGTHLEALKSGAEWWHFQLPQDANIYPQILTYKFVDYQM